jgi:hypothetical protein
MQRLANLQGDIRRSISMIWISRPFNDVLGLGVSEALCSVREHLAELLEE